MGADVPWLRFAAGAGAVLLTFLAGTELENALRDLTARMRVQQIALSDRFSELRRDFLLREGPAARRELEHGVEAASSRRRPMTRTVAIELAHDIARRRVTAWAREAEPRAERLYADAVARFVSLANDFIDRLAPDASAANLKREEFLVERGLPARGSLRLHQHVDAGRARPRGVGSRPVQDAPLSRQVVEPPGG